ncbi:MAG: DUF4145 domain-containing protein [Sediminibacterium sp.]
MAMKCPHCTVSFHAELDHTELQRGSDGYWVAIHQECPECDKAIIFIKNSTGGSTRLEYLAYPKGISRSPLPSEVDDQNVVNDYNESSLVLQDSAKASAALSRRCLQHILREKAGVKKPNLDSEIQEVLDSGTLPSDIAENLDAVRNIGNFAAHPIKSTSSGEIVDVEPNEAEWNLEVLEQLIDFYYVRPAIAKRKRDELNVKLASAGKPPLK